MYKLVIFFTDNARHNLLNLNITKKPNHNAFKL